MRSQDTAALFCALLAKPTTALCHSSASGAWVPALPFIIKSNFPSQQPKGLCNYRSCTQCLGSLGWVEQLQQGDGNFGGRHHREAVGVTNLMKPKLKPCWLLKFPILFKQSTDTPLLATNLLQPLENLGPAQSVTAGSTTNSRSPQWLRGPPQSSLSHNTKPAPHMRPGFAALVWTPSQVSQPGCTWNSNSPHPKKAQRPESLPSSTASCASTCVPHHTLCSSSLCSCSITHLQLHANWL